MSTGPFQYDDAPSPPGARVVSIRSNVHRKRTLLGILARGLSFPKYFGGNWDALADALKTLDGIPDSVVVLRHRDVPGIAGSRLRQIYLEILQEAVESWATDPRRRLIVQFPAHCRRRLEQATRDSDQSAVEREETL